MKNIIIFTLLAFVTINAGAQNTTTETIYYGNKPYIKAVYESAYNDHIVVSYYEQAGHEEFERNLQSYRKAEGDLARSFPFDSFYDQYYRITMADIKFLYNDNDLKQAVRSIFSDREIEAMSDLRIAIEMNYTADNNSRLINYELSYTINEDIYTKEGNSNVKKTAKGGLLLSKYPDEVLIRLLEKIKDTVKYSFPQNTGFPYFGTGFSLNFGDVLGSKPLRVPPTPYPAGKRIKRP